MVIFEKKSDQKFKIHPKTHQIAPFKKIFSGEHTPEPP